MYVDARDSQVRLAETDDLARFSVVAADLESLAERAGQFGYLAEGEAFVRSDWIRNSGPRTRGWAAALDRMLAVAESSGWLSDGHVRAHIVQPGRDPADDLP